MEYFVGKESRAMTVKYQVGLPRAIIEAMKARNEKEHVLELYMTVASAPVYKGSVPFVKCFDHLALERIAKQCIDASKITKAKIDTYGRVCIPEDIREAAKLESIDRIVVVEAESGSNWGMTFGIYEMDNYHKVKANQMEEAANKEK